MPVVLRELSKTEAIKAYPEFPTTPRLDYTSALPKSNPPVISASLSVVITGISSSRSCHAKDLISFTTQQPPSKMAALACSKVGFGSKGLDAIWMTFSLKACEG